MKAKKFTLKTPREGFLNITQSVRETIRESGAKSGVVVVWCAHTTAGITINENADPDVRGDMARIMDCLVCEGEPYYEHTLEGLDDMPAHAKSSLFGVSITIPISAHRLALGTWQGIYLCEFRDSGGSRSIVATVMGE